MDTLDIILWTSSLVLAVAGISFGIIASINSSKANKQIRNLVSDQLVNDEATKFLFKMPEKIATINRNIIRELKSDKDISFIEYSNKAARTRLAPISKRTIKYLLESEYKDLANMYLDTKKRLDDEFKDITNNYEVLQQEKSITKGYNDKFIKYHNHISMQLKTIMTQYYQITK